MKQINKPSEGINPNITSGISKEEPIMSNVSVL